MKPIDTISAFDNFLMERDLSFEAVVIGGTALGLLGIISRQTRDCDILHPQLPDAILVAAKDFAETRHRNDDLLDDNWLNNGPSSLAEVLPSGWLDRLQIAYKGKAITLHCLGREDLLRSKLFALCDRGIDLQDCLALFPTKAELDKIKPWLEAQDANPDWPAHARSTLDDLLKRLGHGV